MKPRLTFVALALASALLTTGCGEGSVDGAGQPTGQADADSSATSSATSSAAPQDTSPREVTGRPPSAAADDSATVLQRVEVTGHEQFDRVRFTFSGGVTKVFAEYLDALREPGRGRTLPLAGEHRLVLVFVGVADRQKTVTERASTTAVRQVRTTGVFEGEMSAGIGTDTSGDGPAGFRVRPNGKTVTVDIAHKASTTSP